MQVLIFACPAQLIYDHPFPVNADRIHGGNNKRPYRKAHPKNGDEFGLNSEIIVVVGYVASIADGFKYTVKIKVYT